MKKSKKRYWFNVVEEAVMNPKFQNFRGGRIEVYDTQDKLKGSYAIYEARFWIPQEFMDGFRELFDFKESNELPRIVWDMEEVENKKSQGFGYVKLAEEVVKSVVADGSQGMRRGE